MSCIWKVQLTIVIETRMNRAFLDKNDVFISSCLQECSCLIFVICVCFHIMVSNTYCVVFVLFFFVFCTLCCQFLRVVHFSLPLPFLSKVYLLHSHLFRQKMMTNILIFNILHTKLDMCTCFPFFKHQFLICIPFSIQNINNQTKLVNNQFIVSITKPSLQSMIIYN